MAEMTLLQMVQSILNSLSSDEVNSISDTTESLQVANLIQNKYYDIVARGGLPSQDVLYHLNPSNDPTKPVLMYLPAGVSSMNWIDYFDSNVLDGQSFGTSQHAVNTDIVTPTTNPGQSAPGYKYVTQLAIDEFIDMVKRFNPSDSNVGSFTFTEGGNDFTFYYVNDKQPQYCTVIENFYVLFDSYDLTQDTTLQSSKTMCWGAKVTPFQLTDNFIPDLDDDQFPLLLNEAKSLAFYELKQMPHQKADQEVKRQWSTVQKNKSISNKPSYFEQLANFGRVPRTGGYSGGGYGAYRWMRQSGS